MWKYVSRRIRDTFERTANHFEKRSSAGVINTSSNLSEEKIRQSGPPCRWYSPQGCWSSHQNSNDTNSNKWNFYCLNRNWIGAITWSSALIVGWYASQIIHLKCKYQRNGQQKICPTVNTVFDTIHPYVNKYKLHFDSPSKIEKIVKNCTLRVHLISNEQVKIKNKNTGNSGIGASPDNSDEALGEVLNSIENRLGLAAIENGQFQDGLHLLKSAANRQYPPALYNLGLCYEIGLGVDADERVAMEMYRSAASLQHPGALYNLGIYYGQGRGGLQCDPVMATRLLRLAAIQGQQDAIDALKALNIDDKKLPPYKDDVHLWTDSPGTFMQSDIILPSPTSLFVENVNYIQSSNKGAFVY